jgi:cytoskeletal protein RodZ
VENDIAQPNPEMSIGTPAPAVEKAKRPKLVIPGSAPVPEVVSEMTPTQRVKTAAAPKPLLPPEGSKPSIHTTAQVLQSARSEEVTPLSAEESEPNPKPVEESAPETKPTKDSAPVEAKTGPPPPTLARATPAAKSSAPALKRATSGAATAQAPISAPATSGDANPQASNVNLATDEKKAPSPPKKKRAISNSVKVMIAVVLGILAVFLGIFFLQKSGKNAEAKLYNEMIAQASQNGATDVSVNKRKLQILLNSSVSVASNNDRANVYIALVFAKATDDTNVDSMIAEFATTQEMNHEIRVKLLGDVLGRRKNPAVIGTLLDFAVSTKETKAAIAAVEASRNMATDAHFAAFLEILKTTKNESIRRASEGTLANIILKSTSPASLADSLANAYSNASDDTIRHSILRLVARAGGAKAVELVKTNLQSEDVKDKIAAIVALGNWADQEGYTVLLDHISKETNLQLRARAFDSALLYARQSNGNTQEIWTMLSGQAKTLKEQLDLIRGLANVSPEPWNFAMLQNFVATGDNNDVVDLAEKVIIHLKDIQKVRGSKDDE